jgi:HEAT repeat protein
MNCEASEDSDGNLRTGESLHSLGEGDWSVRQKAVRDLSSRAAGASIDQLLTILREQHRDLSRLNSAIQVLVRTPFNVVPALLELLAHPDSDVRTYTALTLGERGDASAAPGLIAALTDTDPNVRMHAVEALGRLRAAAAVDELMAIVESRDFELAFPALDALISIGDERIALRLLPLLREPLFKVLTVEALGCLGDEEVVRPLLDLLTDADVPPDSVIVAIHRIHERYQRRYGDETRIPETVRCLVGPSDIQAIISAGRFISSSVAGRWAKILSWLPALEATEALMKLLDRPPIEDDIILALVYKGPSIVPLLLQRLANLTGDGRQAVAAILTRLGNRAAVPVLLSMLDSDEEEDLIRAADSLAGFADLRAYEPLRNLLGHPSPRVRHSVVAAVNSLGHPNTARDLVGEFHNASPLVRESSVRVAAYLGLPLCIDAIFECCDDADERVRRAAIECLPIVDDPRVLQRLGQAIQSDTPPVRAAAAAALAKIDDARTAGTLLMPALEDADVWVRYFAIRSLLSIQQHAPAIAPLIRLATEDVAIQVRVAAIETLAECGSTGLATLVDLASSPIPDLSNAAILALGALPHPEATQIILAAFNSEDRERQIHAIRAAARSRSPDFVELLRARLLAPDDRLAEEASLALTQFPLREAALALIDGSSHLARRENCIVALAKMGDHAIPALAYGLQIYELEIRRTIVEALTRIRTTKAQDVLTIALDDGQPAIRHAALSALANIRRVCIPRDSADGCEGEQ